MNKGLFLQNFKKEAKFLKIDNGYKEICLTYANRLLSKDLPVIYDIKHLSLLLNIRISHLTKMIYGNSKFYKTFYIKKRGNKYRKIEAPLGSLKTVQRWILRNILEKIKTSDYCKGFRPGLSILDNARPHLNKDYVVNVDIQDFFPSIKYNKVFAVFRNLGYTKKVSYVLSKLCTLENRLPQGAPTSPYISNIISKRIDSRIAGICKNFGFVFTRYADDITISGTKKVIFLISFIEKILGESSFLLNRSKTRIMKKGKRQEITGIVVNEKLNWLRPNIRKLRQEIYYCKKYGVEEHLKRKGIIKANFREFMYGKAYYLKMIDKPKGENFLRELDTINWAY